MMPGERCDEIVRLIDAALEESKVRELEAPGRDAASPTYLPRPRRFPRGGIRATTAGQEHHRPVVPAAALVGSRN
jgi:hypothetical protein